MAETNMEHQDIQIITVLTRSFVGLENAIKNTGKGDPEGTSLQDLLATLNEYADSVKTIDQEITRHHELGRRAVFVPYQDDRQWLEAISQLPATIIVLSGFAPESNDFKELGHKAWHQHEKVITDETYRGMAENFTQQFLDMYRAANPRNPKLPSANTRPSTKIKDRYRKFVELANDGKTMKEFAFEMGLSVPSTYLLRKQYREQLESDPSVNQKAQAMKFHKS